MKLERSRKSVITASGTQEATECFRVRVCCFTGCFRHNLDTGEGSQPNHEVLRFLQMFKPQATPQHKGLGTPNREPQEYSRYRIECQDPGRHIPTIFSGFPVRGFQ